MDLKPSSTWQLVDLKQIFHWKTKWRILLPRGSNIHRNAKWAPPEPVSLSGGKAPNISLSCSNLLNPHQSLSWAHQPPKKRQGEPTKKWNVNGIDLLDLKPGIDQNYWIVIQLKGTYPYCKPNGSGHMEAVFGSDPCHATMIQTTKKRKTSNLPTPRGFFDANGKGFSGGWNFQVLFF